MSDISKISVNDVTYDIKDATARGSMTELEGRLGSLAYLNEASGTFTPSGTVTAPTITVTPSSTTVKGLDNAGTLPTWSANVSSETLSFSFTAGSLPSGTDKTVLTGITDATSTAPVFSGTQGTITVM